jgi:N-acetylmuramoyl-L-alanine amidase
MRATSIPHHEASFMQHATDSVGKKFKLKNVSVPIPGETGKVELTECVRENNDKSFYFEEEIAKERIVLHFTAGYLKGDIGTLSTPGNHVSVPYVIGRNGVILNLWPPQYWSYHLGPGAVGGNSKMSSNSIGIEISNIGFLRKSANNLVTAYSKTDVYCSLEETSFYQRQDYRSEKYFATYTNAQYESTIKLLRFLTAKFNIGRKFLPVDKRYEILNTAAGFNGILSHVNFRKDKWDIGPAFDWERVMNGVTA